MQLVDLRGSWPRVSRSALVPENAMVPLSAEGPREIREIQGVRKEFLLLMKHLK